MRRTLLALIGFVVAINASSGLASSRSIGRLDGSYTQPRVRSESHEHVKWGSRQSAARAETLWIFDADFSNMVGDNAGWTSYDMSGTLAQTNYWHHDTIRINGFTHLGDSTWWCGTYNECWRQPRGYGDEWYQVLQRNFPEVPANTSPGDPLYLDFDQRFAMERNYDYGYVDVSTDGGTTWVTHYTVTNLAGTAHGGPGYSQDWDSPYGHVQLDLSAYAGQELDLRFVFDSDWGYSSESSLDNPPYHSVQDGAWQIDNITWSGGDPVIAFWSDDSESGNLGWSHEDFEGAGQTGVTWWRGQYGVDFVTGMGFMCEDRPVGTWMYAAVDPFTSGLVDGEYAWLMSPPIDISATQTLVGSWECWIDAISGSEQFNIGLSSHDNRDCVTQLSNVADEAPGMWVQHPGKWWVEPGDSWDAFAGGNWLSVIWEVVRHPDAPTLPARAGMFLNRQRVGVPSGDPGTSWEFNVWRGFHDWFQDELSEAIFDTAVVKVADQDGIAGVVVVASNDGGQTWESYPCVKEDPGDPEDDWWLTPPPVNQMTPGAEIRYYLESTDGVGNVSTSPRGAPDETFEMSILPIAGDVSEPGLLLVDKSGWFVTPGEQRDFRHTSEYYCREALDVLGYEYDVFDVRVPRGRPGAEGPDTAGMKYYDTQIWFSGDSSMSELLTSDQAALIVWLSQAADGRERNLLLTGNNTGHWLMEVEQETLAFYELWLASHYLGDAIGAVTVDSVPGLVDHGGGFGFMTNDDGECILRGGCPVLNYFDVVEPQASIPGAETVADYIRLDSSTLPAGVAYEHQTQGYQTVNLGFGIEFMMDGTVGGGSANYTVEGHYRSGITDRVDLIDNILTYFGRPPDGYGTGVADIGKDELSHAYPNPFNPATRIAYSVKSAGVVTIKVYDLAGRLVRTLLDAELDAGAYGFVVWDGTEDSGERCASGVYFYRIDSPGFTESRKMILLK